MKNRFGKVIGLSLGLLVLSLGIISKSAFAFTGYGSGSSGAPYYISSCEQLPEIADNLAGHYKIVRNLDCHGVELTSIANDGTPFTGTLDGGGFTISSMEISNAPETGLFGGTDSATISNLAIDDAEINGAAFAGVLIGTATYTEITNVRVTNSIVDGSNHVGGLVGQMGGGSISKSSFTDGQVDATSLAGGLVGYMVGPTAISDSYATGTVYASSGSIGGLIGGIGAGPGIVSNTYAHVELYSTGDNYGGLVGFTTNSGGAGVSYSFAASSMMTGSVEDSVGGAIGDSQSSAGQLWYDADSAWGSCIGTGSGSCTAVNSDGENPDYFFNSTTHGPLESWNFDTTWVVNEDTYPTLMPLFNFGSSGAPNNNDADGNSVDDSYQANVNSVPNPDGDWSTISIPSSSDCSVEDPQWANPVVHDVVEHTLATMTAFKLFCHTPGASVPVTIIYDHQFDTTGLVLRWYNTTTHEYSTVSGAVFGTTVIGGETKTTVTYTVKDGGAYDSDGSSNGVIDDPVAPSPAPPAEAGTPGAPDTGYGRPSSNIAAYLTICTGLVLIGLALKRKSSKH